MWLAEQHPSYQLEKKAKMYDPKYNGGKRYPRTRDDYKADWYNSGTPVEWVYYLESRGTDTVHPWTAYSGR